MPVHFVLEGDDLLESSFTCEQCVLSTCSGVYLNWGEVKVRKVACQMSGAGPCGSRKQREGKKQLCK